MLERSPSRFLVFAILMSACRPAAARVITISWGDGELEKATKLMVAGDELVVPSQDGSPPFRWKATQAFLDATAALDRKDFAASRRLTRPLAEAGDSRAEYRMGFLADKGKDRPKDQTEALGWFMKAHEKGFVVATHSLGLIFHNGWGVPKDEARARFYFALGSRKGYLGSDFCLADSYLTGPPGQTDIPKAVEIFRRAAEKGYPDAQVKMGELYMNGTGVPANFEQAAAWYQRAAAQGSARAEFSMGLLYSSNAFRPRDYVKAREWHLKAASKNFPDALFVLGWYSLQGFVGKKDPAAAIRYFKLAAENSSQPKFVYSIAHMLSEGDQGAPIDPALAAQLYERAAEEGWAPAQHNLALLFFHGRGVQRDYEKGFDWETKAAGHGITYAKENLASYYARGIGRNKNPAEALRWARSGAEDGSAFCEFELSIDYETGFGVKRNDAEAFRWALAAAFGRNRDAALRLSRAYSTGFGRAPRDEALSRAWKSMIPRLAAENDKGFAHDIASIYGGDPQEVRGLHPELDDFFDWWPNRFSAAR
jgi:TPR repeat protein